MLKKYLICFLVSMVPLIELRAGVPFAVGLGLDYVTALIVCVIGNMLPVPVIYFFARKVLMWGRDKKYIGKFFTYCIEKGEKGGQKLTAAAGRGGLFVALMLFVGIPLPGTGAWTGTLAASFLNMGIPLPGTGAWTGTLAASFLNMGIKSTTISVCLGVIIAGIIMGAVSMAGLHVFGL